MNSITQYKSLALDLTNARHVSYDIVDAQAVITMQVDGAAFMFTMGTKVARDIEFALMSVSRELWEMGVEK